MQERMPEACGNRTELLTKTQEAWISYKSDEYDATYKVAKKLAEEFRNKVMFSTVDTDEDDHR